MAQVVGAIVGAALLYLIASGAPGFDLAEGLRGERLRRAFAGPLQPVACLVTEVVLTMMFLFIIMGATHGKAPAGFAPLAIGLGLR